MHVDKPRARGMKEQVDGFCLGHTAVAGEGQWVGAMDADLVAASDQRFELGDDSRAPATSLLDLGHPFFEKPFVDGCHRRPS